MASPSQPLVYAELLRNIRQVSVGCTLQTSSKSDTKAIVVSGGRSLTIIHNEVEKSIPLPGEVNATSRLPIPSTNSTGLSWRLPLAANSNTNVVAASEETVPWSAGDLAPESSITCRRCKASIGKTGALNVWKDLPSENWAEMMEFWHCHKPREHKHGDEEGDDHLASRGYGAGSRISAQPGVGFVDLTSFLLSEADISGSTINIPFQHGVRLSNPGLGYGFGFRCLEGASAFHYGFSWTWGSRDYPEVCQSPSTSLTSNEVEDKDSNGAPAENVVVHCSSCKTNIGVRTDQTSSISLFKWQVGVDTQNQQSLNALPSLQHCVSAILLATMARSGCSKSIILPMKSQNRPTQDGSKEPLRLLHIWVFNGNITFSSTAQPRSPLNAVKVLYRMVGQEQADKMLDSMTSDVQDITLPADAIGEIVQLLNESNGFLPQSDRKFKEWNVGLLEKWDGGGG